MRSVYSQPVSNFINVATLRITDNIIVSDRGTAFKSKLFENYCKENQKSHTKNATGMPRANDRAFKSKLAGPCIQTLIETIIGRDCEINIICDEFSLNSIQSKTTKMCTHRLLHDYSPRNAIQNRIMFTLFEPDKH